MVQHVYGLKENFALSVI